MSKRLPLESNRTWGYPIWLKVIASATSPAIVYGATLTKGEGWKQVIPVAAGIFALLFLLEVFRRSITVTPTHIEARDFTGRVKRIPIAEVTEIHVTTAPRLYIHGRSGQVVMVPQFLGNRERIVATIESALDKLGISVRTEYV